MDLPVILNRKWHMEICNAYTIPEESVARAASRLVVQVPIFEPIVRGYIRFKLITPMPTKGVIAEVKTELLCTRNVKIAPTIIAM